MTQGRPQQPTMLHYKSTTCRGLKFQISKPVRILHDLIHDFCMLSIGSVFEIHKCYILNAGDALGETYQSTYIQILPYTDWRTDHNRSSGSTVKSFTHITEWAQEIYLRMTLLSTGCPLINSRTQRGLRWWQGRTRTALPAPAIGTAPLYHAAARPARKLTQLQPDLHGQHWEEEEAQEPPLLHLQRLWAPSRREPRTGRPLAMSPFPLAQIQPSLQMQLMP